MNTNRTPSKHQTKNKRFEYDITNTPPKTLNKHYMEIRRSTKRTPNNTKWTLKIQISTKTTLNKYYSQIIIEPTLKNLNQDYRDFKLNFKQPSKVPVVPHKAVAEVSKIGNL